MRTIDIDFDCDNHMIMDDMNEQIGALEKDVSILRTDSSVMRHDLTDLKGDVSLLKADVSVLKTDVSLLTADVSVLKADVSELKAGFLVLENNMSVVLATYATKADLASLEAAMLKWYIATTTTLAGVAFAFAKYVH